jgi:hypothetical protein
LNGSNLRLQWPASGVGFALYSSTNLVPTPNWTLSTDAPVLVNGQWDVLVGGQTGFSKFYRLQSQ